MRLFHIDRPGCHHMMKKIVGIQAVYQLEAEFEPYLTVDFLPNPDKTDPGGVILQAGSEVIRKNYLFDDPNDIIELRKLIWDKVRKYHNPKDITEKGCMDKFKWQPTFKVIQGWQAKKRLIQEDQCCIDLSQYMNAPDPATKAVLHEVYRVDTRDKLDRNTCKKVRCKECSDNFPTNTDNFRRCIQISKDMCDEMHPINKKKNAVVENRAKLYEKIKQYLELNDYRTDKQHLDTILDNWFFQDVSPREGNNFIYDPNTASTINKHIIKTNEGFGKSSISYRITVILILVVLLVIYFCNKQS